MYSSFAFISISIVVTASCTSCCTFSSYSRIRFFSCFRTTISSSFCCSCCSTEGSTLRIDLILLSTYYFLSSVICSVSVWFSCLYFKIYCCDSLITYCCVL